MIQQFSYKNGDTIMQINQQTLDFIESLYLKESPLLFHYAKAIFGNDSIAEEVIQETFIIACINHKKLMSSPNPEGWIMNTHKNVCRNMKRSRANYLKRILTVDSYLLETVNADQGTPEINEDLTIFVNSDDYSLLKKIILDGYSIKEMANELNISIDACRKRFQRAKQKFQDNYLKSFE